MFRQGIFLLACVVMLPVAGRAAGPTTTPQDQAASPPPSKAQTSNEPQAIPPVTLDELAQLAAKLKSNGDQNGAELLERFVRQQQPSPRDRIPLRQVEAERILIEIEVFEVNADQIPSALRLETYPTGKDVKDAHETLDQLVKTKKAKVVLPRRTFDARWSRVVQFEESNDHRDMAIANEDGTIEFLKQPIGLKGEVLALLKPNGMMELHQTVELSRTDEQNSITLYGKTVPGIAKRKIQSVNETIIGQPQLLIHFGGVFVFTTVNPKPSDANIDANDR